MKELFNIKAESVNEIGFDTKNHEHFIAIGVLRQGVPDEHRLIIEEDEYIALCGWIQLATTTNEAANLRSSAHAHTQVLFRTFSLKLADVLLDATRLRERVSDTFVQQHRWEQIRRQRGTDDHDYFWEATVGQFGFTTLAGGSIAFYKLERQIACKQVDTGYHPEIAEKLTNIAISPLFPRVDYELQLRWRNGQDGIEGGYATIARVDKNDIRNFGKLLGGNK